MSSLRKIILKDSVKFESSVVTGFINERHFAIEILNGKARLANYRDPGDESPSKSWKINKMTSVGGLGKRQFNLRTDSMLGVPATKSYKTEELHSFTVSFGSTLPWRSEKLTLCFQTPEAAQQWHDAIKHTIKSLSEKTGSLRSGSLESLESTDALETTESEDRVTAEGACSGNLPEPERSQRSWRSVRNVNGVAMYAEDGGPDCESGAVMASSVVRAPPVDCFRALMRPNSVQNSGDLPFADSMTVLETIDSNTDVVRHWWGPAGATLSRLLCAPRDMVALRTWRREPDGTYIILYQSTNHRKARVARAGWMPWSWRGTVRTHVEAAGFTIAPLLPQYIPGGEGISQECLVTLVVKADMGGGLSEKGAISQMAPAVAIAMQWVLLEPLLMSVVRLRDRVEQSRFVVMPYTMAAEDDAVGVAESEVKDAGNAGGVVVEAECLERSPRDFSSLRTSTMLIRSPRTRLSSVSEEDDVAVARGGHIEDGAFKIATRGGPEMKAAGVRVGDVAETIWGAQGTCDRRFWSYPGTSNLRIRGSEYLTDRLKIPAAAPMFDLYASDLVDADEPQWHVSRVLPSLQHCQAPFAFVLNLIFPVPSAPLQSLVSTWTAPVNPQTESLEALVERWGEDPDGTVRAFFHNLQNWLKGDGDEADKRRSRKFKLIPRVAKGSWVVRQSVGVTPVLLGQKLKTKYFRGSTKSGCSYFEVDVDITSNSVANSVTRLVVNSITSLVVDLAPLIEGQTVDELPERLLGTVRYEHLDLRTASAWDEERREVVPKAELEARRQEIAKAKEE